MSRLATVIADSPLWHSTARGNLVRQRSPRATALNELSKRLAAVSSPVKHFTGPQEIRTAYDLHLPCGLPTDPVTLGLSRMRIPMPWTPRVGGPIKVLSAEISAQ